jgi:hypothetical protein
MRARHDDVLATVLRIAHDVSLAAWFGGALMGAVGLNSATMEVDDHTQRTRVANAGWFRWAPFVAVAVVVHVGAAAVRGRLHGIRAGATALAVAATVGTGVAGERVVRGGDVPVATAVRPIQATPPDVAGAQRQLRLLQWMVPGLTAVLWVLEGLQDRR